MRIIKEAYSTLERLEFYNYVRRLDTLKATMDKDKTLILPADNQLTNQILKLKKINLNKGQYLNKL